MTLIESCLVVAIASIGASIALPSLIRARESYTLNAAAGDVSSKLHAARIHAVTQGRDCRLRVVSPQAYVVECQPSGAPEWTLVESTDTPRGITVSANARPEFHRRGNVSPAATISLWNPRGTVKQVVINIAGRVRIQ